MTDVLEEYKVQRPIEVGTKVRFRDPALSRMEPKSRKRLTGRVGEVTGYRTGVNAPLVHFPRIGKFQQLLLCDVDAERLEQIPTIE